MGAKYVTEVSAIQQLRDKYPAIPQKTLARRIVSRDFTSNADKNLAGLATTAGLRSTLSVYSVIRRYDASKASKTTVAA
jgi:hypothetical protein